MGDIKVTVVEVFYDRLLESYGFSCNPFMGSMPLLQPVVHKNVIEVSIDESDYSALEQALMRKSTIQRGFTLCVSLGEDGVLGELDKFKKLKQIDQYNALVSSYNSTLSRMYELDVTLKKCKSAKGSDSIKKDIEVYNKRLEDAFNEMSAHPLFRDEKCENGYYLRHTGDY